MKRWILIDYGCTGLYEIQARDEHPKRDNFDDERAVALVRRQAKRGKKKAIEALRLHERDAGAIMTIREAENGPRETWGV